MCHHPQLKTASSYTLHSRANTCAQDVYVVRVLPILHRTHRFSPIEIVLKRNNRTWVGTIPYSRWANKNSLIFAATKEGMPMKKVTQYRQPAHWIPDETFKEIENVA